MSKMPGPVGAPHRPLSTREKILDAAVECLIENGVAGTTTLAVQHKAEVSRGSLLHHFPTHAVLLAATVAELVHRNELAVSQSHARDRGAADSLELAVKALVYSARQPAYLAELELWAVARTDPMLRQALSAAERGARRDLDRVYRHLFSDWTSSDAYDDVVALTLHFIRGLAISEPLRGSARERERMVSAWIDAMRLVLSTARGVASHMRKI